jgi:hypothetical protein
VLFVIALVSTFPMLWVMGRIWLTSAAGKPAPFVLSATLFYWAFVIKPFVCAAFCMAMAAMAYLSRKESSGHSPGGSETGGGSPVRSPASTSPGSSRAAFGRR